MTDAAKGLPRRDVPTRTHPALRNVPSAQVAHRAPQTPATPTAAANSGHQPFVLQTAPGAFFVAGRYELLQRIAIGGMAEIWRARMVGLAGFSRTVVLKRMLPHLALDPVFVTMFLDEARLGARLHHHNIVAVLDIGSDPHDGYFFAMESLDGADLRALLMRGPLPLDLIIWVALNVCAGLHYAHGLRDEHHQPLGIVHRDISPANIFVCHDGGIKLVDFGIARSTTRTDATDPGAVRGKLRYMSPEQARADALDARSDIFSLGAVLFELIANCPLFGQAHDAGVLDALLNQPIRSLRSAAPQCPPELAAIVDKALARAPDARYASADAMAMALAAWARTAGVWPAATAATSAVARAQLGNHPAPLATRARDTGSHAPPDTQHAAPGDLAIAPDTLARLQQLTSTAAVPALAAAQGPHEATQSEAVGPVDSAAMFPASFAASSLAAAPDLAAPGASDHATTAPRPHRAWWRMTAWGVGLALAALTVFRLTSASDTRETPQTNLAAPTVRAATATPRGTTTAPLGVDAAPALERFAPPLFDAASNALPTANAGRDNILPSAATTKQVSQGPASTQPSSPSKTRPRSGNHSDRNSPTVRPRPAQLTAPQVTPGPSPSPKPDPDAFRPGAP